MIEKLDTTNNFSFDFLQDSTNQKIINKVNEIINYINHKESMEKQKERGVKMKVNFINIGRNKVNFTRNTNELTYEWLLQQVEPHLLSHNIDFEENRKGTITVFAGMQTVGEIEVLEN